MTKFNKIGKRSPCHIFTISPYPCMFLLKKILTVKGPLEMKSTGSLIKKSSDRQPDIEVFGLSGSPRINGNSDILLKNIISGVARENVVSDCLNLTKLKFQGCIGCEKCRKDKICTGLIDGMTVIYERIISSKGLVLVSPDA